MLRFTIVLIAVCSVVGLGSASANPQALSGAVFRIGSGAFTLAVKSSTKRGTHAFPPRLHEFKVTAM